MLLSGGDIFVNGSVYSASATVFTLSWKLICVNETTATAQSCS